MRDCGDDGWFGGKFEKSQGQLVVAEVWPICLSQCHNRQDSPGVVESS